jgi:hypothetical protein
MDTVVVLVLCFSGGLGWLGVDEDDGTGKNFQDKNVNPEANLIGASCGVPIADFHAGRCFV